MTEETLYRLEAANVKALRVLMDMKNLLAETQARCKKLDAIQAEVMKKARVSCAKS